MPLHTIMTAANTVSRASPAFSAAAEHDGDDQRHLDDRHRDGQHERAERLADPVGDDLGVIDGGEHGSDQDGAREGRNRPRRHRQRPSAADRPGR